MLLKRIHWLHVVALLLLVCLVDVLFQLGLPGDTTSSKARVGDIDLVSMKESDIERTLQAYEDSSYLYIDVGDEQYIKKFKELGINIDVEHIKQKAHYPLRSKLIPFSALVRYWSAEEELTYTYNSQQARPFIEEIAAYGSVEPEPARLIASDGQVGVVADIPGSNVDVEDALLALGQIEYQDRTVFYADDYAVRHELDEAMASDLAKDANKIIASPPQLSLSGQTVSVAPTNMAEWFTITEQDDEYQLALDEQQVSEYLDEVARELFVPSVGAQVTLLDGREITRVDGVSGKILDKAKALADLRQVAAGAELSSSIELALVDVSPGVSYDRTYSDTPGGFSVFLQDTAKRGSYYVSVWGIDNPSLRASYRGDNRVTAASTYKVYVAYYVMHEIEQGRADWAQKLPSGRQLDNCLEEMIVVSSNSCALEVRDYFGIGAINARLAAVGLGASSVGPATTTANNLSSFMYQLSTGSLLSKENSDKLIDMMRRQIHRLAIPAGVSPTEVADKGGFISGYNHDTGIVFASNGRYAMTIMSSGGYSKASLASLANDLHQFILRL